nr:hypothetical protein [Tanacetum cinerariifolium]
MGDGNLISTLGDYSRLSTRAIETPLNSLMGTMWCFCDLAPSRLEDLTTRFLAQFFPSERTSKLSNDILMFQQHQDESLLKHELISRTYSKKSLIMKDKNMENNKVVDNNVIELSELNVIEPKEEVDMKKEVGYETNNKPVRSVKEEITGDGIEELLKMPRITNEKPVGTSIRLSLASHSYIFPLGITEDVLVEIASYIYPVAFVILDVNEDKKNPFILGTPFLTTATADIRFDKGTITLKSGKNKTSFFKISESPCRVEEETKNDKDPVAPTNIVIFDEEKLKSS